MAIRGTIFASTFFLLGIAPALADALQPVEGRVIDLGRVTGVVYYYYAPEPDGYRVVATFAEENGNPVRFEAVLAPGQSVVLSAPRELGAAPRAVRISRQGDRVLLQEADVTN
jgi:hypothetical protein